ncbi:uncharacterized protein LOC119989468 [Tripterygium wilfordii]|uniref:uncharacterized protein LOC119989468 n=1 Tax=Tripterygium wilfordii TaxID=458696 RepID=UPI0018F7E6DE|nr:uncharacterized protein LOC119989468 [Tripterygium wilfordii]XP_038690933.1 uncharacterized protein LOC119989468 [Tripterygium wilfordii]
MSTKKPEIAHGLKRRRMTKRSCFLEKQKATVDKLSAKLAKKKEKIKRMKNGINDMMAKLEDVEWECARMREEYQLAIEQNVDLQLALDYILFAFLRGGDAGS